MNTRAIAKTTTQKYLKPMVRPYISRETVTGRNGWETEIITLNQGTQEIVIRENWFRQTFRYFFANYDYRELTRRRFNSLMKKGQLSRPTLIALLNKIYSYLGSKAKKYKSYSFENEAHQIYVLLKDYNLKQRHFKKLLKFLNKLYIGLTEL